MHFLNNGLIVTQLYIVTKQGKSIEKAMDEKIAVWWGIIGLFILWFSFKAFKKHKLERPDLRIGRAQCRDLGTNKSTAHSR